MGTARQKLNIVHVYACLFVAALFGLSAGSWAVFWIALANTIGCGVYGGEIRPKAGMR